MAEGGTPRSWLLYACRSAYVVEVAEIIWRRGDDIEALVDNVADGMTIDSPIARMIDAAHLDEDLVDHPVTIPLLTPGFRRAVAQEARELGCATFPTLVDPTSVIARTAVLGEGTVVNAGVVVGANTRIGRFVHVNRSASIAHDDVIDEYASIGPGAVLAGSVMVGAGAFLGAGVVCGPEVSIGPNAVVGAGAVVVRDIPSGSVAVGNPARVIRDGIAGYRDVGVPVDS